MFVIYIRRHKQHTRWRERNSRGVIKLVAGVRDEKTARRRCNFMNSVNWQSFARGVVSFCENNELDFKYFLLHSTDYSVFLFAHSYYCEWARAHPLPPPSANYLQSICLFKADFFCVPRILSFLNSSCFVGKKIPFSLHISFFLLKLSQLWYTPTPTPSLP